MTNREILIKLKELRALPNETEWVEFKEAKNSFDFNKLGKYFSALCNEANLKNKKCGWLLFGIDNRHNIVGTNYRNNRKKLDNLKSEIAQQTTNNITFQEIYEVFSKNKRVIIFQIPPAPKGLPVAWQGHYYGRNGEELSALNIQEIEQLRGQRDNSDWSAEICKNAKIDDLDQNAIIKAREEYKLKNPNKKQDLELWDDVTFLNKAKLTIQGKITNTAIIFLGKEESEHFLSPALAKMTWVLKDDKNNSKDYEHFGPPFILNVDKLFSKIRNLKYRFMPDRTLFPIEINQYHPWIIREALHNCIAHQDYSLKGRITVVEKSSELIFTNLGSFIPGSVDNVIEMNAPPEYYRNPFLVNAMVNLNMIDTIGGGIRKMFNIQKERYFPMPDYILKNTKKVTVKLQGKVIDESYTRLLIENKNLPLREVILLDKIQKGIHISKEENKYLKSKKLVEGRYPNLYFSSSVAKAVNKKAQYIKNRGFDNKYYQDLITEFIKKHGSASRKDIDNLILNKLPDFFSKKQKKKKISNLLNSLSLGYKQIRNIGSRTKPKWILLKNHKK